VLAGILAFIGWIPLMVVFTDRVRDPGTGRPTDFAAGLAVTAAVVLALGGGILFYLAIRALKRRRRPLRPDQAVWGLAAFYTGGTHLGFSSANAVYQAARLEWIAALVKANPEQVDDAAYQALLGAARPSSAPGARPFGPT
jgi:hypothetical protein